jgi:hypothetical protein
MVLFLVCVGKSRPGGSHGTDTKILRAWGESRCEGDGGISVLGCGVLSSEFILKILNPSPIFFIRWNWFLSQKIFHLPMPRVKLNSTPHYDAALDKLDCQSDTMFV